MATKIIVTPLAHCRLGLGRVDITPPLGIYHRNWGAALHDAAEGLHRPLTATALRVQDQHGQQDHLLVALDLGWLRGRELRNLRRQVSEGTGTDPDRLVITFSHTHAGPSLDLDRANEPGGVLIEPYLEALPGKIISACKMAQDNLQAVEIAFTYGHCDLARQRDYWDDETQQYTCGTNPDGVADDTVLVARITDQAGKALAHLVNYGCHPTTLAWENRLLSPDYIGAMREVVEQVTAVPCVFVLGACGDQGPKDGFTGDPAIADRNGRQLGYAGLAAIESLPPPGTEMRYAGPVISGATLGIWKHEPVAVERLPAMTRLRSTHLKVEWPFKDLPGQEELETRLRHWRAAEEAARQAGDQAKARDCRAQVERVRRSMRRIEGVSPDGKGRYPVWLWQIGEAILVFLAGEPYNLVQRVLRARFPKTPILVGVLSNQSMGYLLSRDQYGKGIYQDSASVLAPGCLEEAIEAITRQLQDWQVE